MAPTAVVIGVVGYCCWPYLGGSTVAPVEAASKLPEISAALLSPTIEPAPDRDPFGATRQAQMDVPEGDTAANATVGPHGTAARTGPSSTLGSVPGATPGASGTAPAGQGSGPTKDKTIALSGLALNATCIQGDRRIAVINGRQYAQGESLSVSNFTTEPYIVTEIQPYKVLLAFQGASAELTYSNQFHAPSPSPPEPNKVVDPRPANPVPSADTQTTPRIEAATPPDTSGPSQAIAEPAADMESEALHE